MTTKAELHQLIEQLPEQEWLAAARFLEYLRDRDPVRCSLLLAPEDDEPLTAEDEQRLREGREAYRLGEYISADEAKRELLG